jgi:hypothetical protein
MIRGVGEITNARMQKITICTMFVIANECHIYVEIVKKVMLIGKMGKNRDYYSVLLSIFCF